MNGRRGSLAISLSLLLLVLVGTGRPQQTGKAPAWVTKGAAAFPDLQKNGIFGRGKAWLDEFDTSGEALEEAKGWAVTDLGEALLDLAVGVVRAYGAVLPEPLDEWEELMWAANCRKRAIGVLSASEPPELLPARTENYLDEKEGVWHALAWLDLSFNGFVVMDLIAFEFSQELGVLFSAKKIKIDGKKHGALLFGAMEAWAVKEGLSWRPKK